MRFARGDMRDHIVSCKNGHRASYRRYGVLQWRSRLEINVCEIFGVVRFSTFATISAQMRSPRPRRATSEFGGKAEDIYSGLVFRVLPSRPGEFHP